MARVGKGIGVSERIGYADRMRSILIIAAFAVAGCASTAMKGFVGQDISEVMIRHGEPARIIDMPDGRRAYQFKWGGGIIPVAGTTTTTFTGNTITTNETPSMVYKSEGCLLTFITQGSGNRWTVVETRAPKKIVC